MVSNRRKVNGWTKEQQYALKFVVDAKKIIIGVIQWNVYQTLSLIISHYLNLELTENQQMASRINQVTTTVLAVKVQMANRNKTQIKRIRTQIKRIVIRLLTTVSQLISQMTCHFRRNLID